MRNRILGIFTFLLLMQPLLANGAYNSDGRFNRVFSYFPHMMGMGVFFMFIPIIVLAILVWLFLRNNKKYENRIPNALDILKKRYAKGEISKEGFTQMKKDLAE